MLWRHGTACAAVDAGGGNFNCPIPGPKAAVPQDDGPLAEFEDELSRTIVDCEVNSSAWTLMHRYNKATELMDSVLNVSCLACCLSCCHFILLTHQQSWARSDQGSDSPFILSCEDG